MLRYLSVFALAVVSAALPSPAAGQEAGKIGLTMGYPGSVGVIWHATQRVALRPEFTFQSSSSDDDAFDLDSQSFTVGVSALYYLRQYDRLATYLSPRYSFGRSSTTADSSFAGEQKTVARNHLFSGSFGAQYSLSDRFSVFGELGMEYRHSTAESEGLFGDDDDESISAFGTRTAVGIVFYF